MPKKNVATSQLQIQLPQDPISIKIVRDPIPSLTRNLQKALLYIIALTLVLVFIVTMLWALYVLPHERQVLTFDPPINNISVVIQYPKYLTKNDEGTIDIEVINQGDVPLNNVQVSVLFSEPRAVSLAIGTNNMVEMEVLKPGAGTHQQFRVKFVEQTSVNLHVRLTQSGVISRSTNSLVIKASPLPFPLGSPLQQIVSTSAVLGLLSIIVKWIFQLAFREELKN